MTPDGNEPETLWRTWHAAVKRPDVVAALEQVRAEVESRIHARAPICELSGRCCNFDAYGHRLYVTGLEIAWLLAHAPQPELWQARLTPEGACPFQIQRRCTVHLIRPLACRSFFCQKGTEDWQRQLHEHFLASLRELHDRFALPYRYMEWRAGLGEALASGA
jgi:Fe-S-cluster containining protein